MPPQKRRRGGRPPLEERFEFLGDAAITGDPQVLRSAVYPVVDRATGVERSLRLWKKTGGATDADLRALWRHEQLQVQRLMASAGAPEVIVDVLEFVEDDEEFGAVLQEAGQPLSGLLRRAQPHHWLRGLGAPRHRSLFWRGVRRIAEAIGLLHAQGLIHGRIGPDVVMTRGAEEPDFRLTGFEWSLWFAAPQPTRAAAKVTGERGGVPTAYSFASDWKALGEMVAAVLGLRLAPDGTISPAGEAAAPNSAERSLIRRLVSPSRTEAVDAVVITRAIDDIVRGLAREGAVRSGTLILHITEHSGLAEAVGRATGNGIEPDDLAGQASWAMADLAGGADLLVPVGGPSPGRPMVLATATVRYAIQPARRTDGEPTWDLGYCGRARLREDEPAPPWRVDVHRVAHPIEVVPSLRQAWQRRDRLGPAALDWGIFVAPDQGGRADGRADLRRALVLVQAVEAVTKALEALPVEVVRATPTGARGFAYDLRARVDSDRDRIARALGLSNTVDTLYRLFEEERQDKDEGWFLGPSSVLGGDRRADVAAVFVGARETRGLRTYRFEVEEEPEAARGLFLRPAQDTGTEGAIARRLRSIAALADLPGLADMLADPWATRRSTRAQIEEDDAFRDLDGPKQAALRGIATTSPGYLVVGPPGVGKTHLATEVVRRRFVDEPSSRLLLTAQGHDALDNLQDAVGTAFEKAAIRDALLVRAPAERRDGGAAGSLRQVVAMLEALRGSPLAERVLLPVAPRIEAVLEAARAASSRAERPEGGGAGVHADVRATVDLLMDAANVVVATINSPAVERLVAERGQFDGVLVEEAAKATGPELVGALALSGKRLMIGDHHQLPPFDADNLERLLLDHAMTKEVLARAGELVGDLFPEGDLEDLKRALASEETLERLRGLALRLVQPFRFFAEEDDRRAAANPNHRRISSTLTEQRRMHPAAAEVVSKAFYGGRLTTSEAREREAYTRAPPFRVRGPLPASPLVLVDFPHVSLTGRPEPMERGSPRWHNPHEVRAAVDVLRLVEPAPRDGKPPTLAVLSPYAAQVAELEHGIGLARRKGTLNLDGFRSVRKGVGFVGTTDSFQGAEADLVIVSLVRNNALAGARALGFLRDKRRMNVLLSRAKAKLVVVTSLRFLEEAVRSARPGQVREELAFLRSVLDSFGDLCARTGPDGIPLASVVAPGDLRAAP